MTERVKMLAGDWYDANYDQELLEIRLKAEQYCYDFNNARPQSVQQTESLKKIFGTEIPEGVTPHSENTPLSIIAAISWTARRSSLAAMCCLVAGVPAAVKKMIDQENPN